MSQPAWATNLGVLFGGLSITIIFRFPLSGSPLFALAVSRAQLHTCVTTISPQPRYLRIGGCAPLTLVRYRYLAWPSAIGGYRAARRFAPVRGFVPVRAPSLRSILPQLVAGLGKQVVTLVTIGPRRPDVESTERYFRSAPRQVTFDHRCS